MAKLNYQRKWSSPTAITTSLVSLMAVIFCGYTLAAFGYDLATRLAISEMIRNIEEKRRGSEERIPALNPPGLQSVQALLGFGSISPQYTARLQEFLDLALNAESSFVLPAWDKLDTELTRSSNLERLEVLPRSRIAQIVRSLDSLKRDADNTDALIKEQLEKQKLLRDRVRLVRESLAEHLGFSHLQLSNQSDDEEISFYKGGVLAGITAIPGLADDLPDLPSLRDQLLKLKASVTVQGPDAQEVFVQGLDSIREQSQEMSLENTSIQAAISDLKRKQTEIFSSSQAARAELKAVLEQCKGTLAALRH